MSLRDFVSPEGLRVDGRRPPELRRLEFECGALSQMTVDGSAVCHQGNTTVLATVIGPRQTRDSRRGKQPDTESSVIAVEFDTADFATLGDSHSQQSSRRQTEYELLIRDSLNGVVLTSLIAPATITVTLQVLHDDGAVLACAVNAATAALVHAGVPMRDLLVSCSIALPPSAHSTLLIDPNIQESVLGVPITTIGYCAVSGKIAFFHHGGKVDLSQLNESLALARDASLVIHESMKSEMLRYSQAAIEGLSTSAPYHSLAAMVE